MQHMPGHALSLLADDTDQVKVILARFFLLSSHFLDDLFKQATEAIAETVDRHTAKLNDRS